MPTKPLTFSIVDVFAENKYEGNQLAVFHHAAGLSTEDMQSIAKEMNYSETTFILSGTPVNGGYDVRIFTPEEELPFAGHPTLGTAFVIQKEFIGHPVEQIMLNYKVGQIPVTFTGQDGMAWMKQKSPVFGDTMDAEAAARMLGIKVEDLDQRFPIQEVSTGLSAMIVPLRHLDAVKRCKINLDLYHDMLSSYNSKAVLVFSPEAYDPQHALNVRVFVDVLGIPEDPATGSANGDLAGYLVKHRYFGTDSIDIQVEQGYEIKRPSLLHLRAHHGQDDISIEVGGKTVHIAKGEWA
jgi:trans-2,3-dihydro-3-hydroxyanthranilate isomerase